MPQLTQQRLVLGSEKAFEVHLRGSSFFSKSEQITRWYRRCMSTKTATVGLNPIMAVIDLTFRLPIVFDPTVKNCTSTEDFCCYSYCFLASLLNASGQTLFFLFLVAFQILHQGHGSWKLLIPWIVRRLSRPFQHFAGPRSKLPISWSVMTNI